ncbi:MAG: TIM barrel protein [Phycisphaerales bacterium]
MLLTLTAISLRAALAVATRGRSAGKAKLDLLDLPQFTRDELGLHGLNISTDLLTGMPREKIERLRERADKAGCACLLLIESDTQPLGDYDEAAGAGAIERLHRVVQAAHVLGCSAVALRPSGEDQPAIFQRTIDRLRKVVEKAERLEMNLLISPGPGLASTPERITELIKKVGGFRVGTFPDFQAAAASPDPVGYLRRLTPYASVVSASTVKFAAEKGDEGTGPFAHSPYELGPLVEAILSVGYDGTLAIDYRGAGDAKLGVVRSRVALERLLMVTPEDAEE